MKSIRVFLLTALLVVMLVVMGAAALFSYFDSVHEIDEIFDARLAQYTRLLSATAVDNVGVIIPVPERHSPWIGHRYESKIAFQIWRTPTDLLARSENAGTVPFAVFKQGFHNERINAKHWRVFVLEDEATHYWLMVAEEHDVRSELVHDIAANAVLPPMIGTVVALILMGWILKRGFKPLAYIAEAITHRRADDLTPLQFSRVPVEVSVLVDNINSLLVRVHASLERERRFSADAAHEMKTPLAALKLHIANLKNENVQDGSRTIVALQSGVEELQRTMEQLLTLNRLEPQYFSHLLRPVLLLPLCRDVLSQEAVIAFQKSQSLSMESLAGAELDETLSVQSDPAVLQILLRNLIHNAIIYTQQGGQIIVRVYRQAENVVLEVSDNGPGIPADERAHVLERFYRVGNDSHASGASGSGLGLSIVHEIVCLHHGSITLQDGDGGKGLCVQVSLPLITA